MEIRNILKNHRFFLNHVIKRLGSTYRHSSHILNISMLTGNETSVLFLLGRIWNRNKSEKDICLILNKRSMSVKQPGDLCCPGGGLNYRFDSRVASLLQLPGFPFGWQRRKMDKNYSRNLAILFATALREGFEEMRLIPFLVKFLGPLPPQELIMFRQVIYPMVSWISYQKWFLANNEVEKVIYIPIKNLIHSDNYARYRLNIRSPENIGHPPQIKDFPCYLHKENGSIETLWGATFRMVMAFLKLVFGFRPPDESNLPIINGSLSRNYLTGNHKKNSGH